MTTAYIGSPRGKMTLPDGRIMTLNGFGNLAFISDGTKIRIGGTGPLNIPDQSQVSATATPSSGNPGVATTIAGTVSSKVTEPVSPTGTVTLKVRGTVYTATQAVGGGGSYSFNVPGAAFTNGPGDYIVEVDYGGDDNFQASTTTVTYTVNSP